MSDISQAAHGILDLMTFEVVNGEMDRAVAGEVGAFIRAQAAELTRLRARIEAADKLAEAADDCVARFIEAFPAAADYPPIKAFSAALSAYEEARK